MAECCCAAILLIEKDHRCCESNESLATTPAQFIARASRREAQEVVLMALRAISSIHNATTPHFSSTSGMPGTIPCSIKYCRWAHTTVSERAPGITHNTHEGAAAGTRPIEI